MTEVPEHLLRRSRERRAALGLGGGQDGGGSDGAPVPSTTGAGAVEPAGGATALAGAQSRAPSVPTPSGGAPALVEEPTIPPYVAYRAATRSRIPPWVFPVLLFLPFWGMLYVGAFGDRSSNEVLDPVALGGEVYRSAGCSACHGGAGEGGVGPALAGGEAALTFPDEADHISWVRTGSAPFAGQPYGDPDRPGGQRGPAKGAMPGFANLSDEEVAAVVAYEREGL